MIDTTPIQERFQAVAPLLNERTRRAVAAAEAMALGRGGIAAVARATGVSRRAIAAGIGEMRAPAVLPPGRIRRPGAGRKPLTTKDPTLLRDLEALAEPTSRGDPESPLRWSIRSYRTLAAQLQRMGHQVSHTKVGELLRELRYGLQGNRKTLEGKTHPDRNAQFEYINAQVEAFLAGKLPVISVDAKKRELVGNFKNGGREWRPQGQPVQVNAYDFIADSLGRATPYGVYDIAHNEGWVNVGITHNTAAFAVASIRRWWEVLGRERFPDRHRLLITADSGGSNGARVRLWKRELQVLADETGVEITVCHLSPGTSKWNKIEHRLFSRITENWRGQPLVTHEVIVSLIAATKTSTGLTVHCELDKNDYPSGVKVSDAEMRSLNIRRHDFHGEWNYTISPRPRDDTSIP